MNKAYKYRIYPTKEQQIIFAKTFGCVRFIYNKMLNDKIEHYKNTKENLYCYPSQYKENYPFLKEIDSLALVGSYNNLQSAYKNFFKQPKVGFPKFKSKKKNKFSYTTNNQKGSVRIENNKLKLPKIGFVKIKLHRQIPKDAIIKSATVSKTPSGKYYVSILCEFLQNEVIPIIPKNILGLDFSMSELYVASDNTKANYPKYYRNSQKKLAKLQRKLSKKVKGSSNRNKQRIIVANFHEKVSNQRKDFLHKLSRKITNSYDAVCIESLNMKGMSKALNFGKSVADNGWGMFTTMLDYKLKEQGKQLIKIDKWFPSSKTCSHCGNVKSDLALSDRTYICDACGFVIDRDYNASLNIKEEGIRLLA